MKVIIIEGTDNVGKDTVIKRLANDFNKSIIYHCEKPKSKTPEEQSAEQEAEFAKLVGYSRYCAMKHSDGTYIHNRSAYGEYVYGCMYRNNDEQDVVNMIWNFEKALGDDIDIRLIVLLSNSVDFLVKNDDGLSISNAKKELIEEETRRFEEIFCLSKLKHKKLVYVNNGDKFREKDDIYNEIMKFINEDD